MQEKYLTVKQLSKYIKEKFDRDPYLETVYLTGEISNFNRNRKSGHQYFSLKDQDALISAVMFAGDYAKVNFQPEDGMQVLVIGRVSVYPKQGRYQFYVSHMEPDGLGQLYLKYEETKKKLTEEGLFSLPKKPIPKYPKRIAVVTSESGAVIQDIIRNVRLRYPIVQLILYPTVVQGERAQDSIIKNLQAVDRAGNFDTVIVGRGGGSFEDLFAFNEEAVVRQIAAMETPVISSVGHETDTSLSDFAADYRASTPTEAAVVAVPEMDKLLIDIQEMRLRLLNAEKNQLGVKKQRLESFLSSFVFTQPERLYQGSAQDLDELTRRLEKAVSEQILAKKNLLQLWQVQLQKQEPSKLIQDKSKELDYLSQRLEMAGRSNLDQQKQSFQQLILSLDLLSPLKILGRGYSYTSKNDEIISRADQVSQGDLIDIHLGQGWLEAEVKETHLEEE